MTGTYWTMRIESNDERYTLLVNDQTDGEFTNFDELINHIVELEAAKIYNKSLSPATASLRTENISLRARISKLEEDNHIVRLCWKDDQRTAETNSKLIDKWYQEAMGLRSRIADAEDRAVHWHKQHGILRARIAELEGKS